MFEYTRQLILSYQNYLSEIGVSSFKVGIVLLGNAWRLGNLVYNEAGLTNVDGVRFDMQKYLTNHLSGLESIDITFPSSDSCSVKQSIASGGLMYSVFEDAFGTDQNSSSHIRMRHGFMGKIDLQGQLHEQSLGSFMPQQPAETRRINTAPSIHKLQDVFPRSSNFEYRMNEHPHFNGQGLHFACIELNNQLRRQWMASDEKIVLSPMRDFLEHVWKPVLSS
jgi:hypothetical protein